MICPMIKTNGLKSFMPFILAGIFSTFLGIPYQLSGQEKNEEVTIIAPYNPTVTAAQKINRNPRIILQENETLPFDSISYENRKKNNGKDILSLQKFY